MDEDIYALQQEVFSQWHIENQVDYTIQSAGLTLRRNMEQIVQARASGAVLLLGPSCEVCSIVGPVLASQTHPSSYNKFARINGLDFESDSEALLEIANAFMLQRSKDRQFLASLEDLEDFLKQCFKEGYPGVIFIENFQVFTHRKRQTLLYTLLDYMHNKNLFFMVNASLPNILLFN
jgi:hypothetical protein